MVILACFWRRISKCLPNLVWGHRTPASPSFLVQNAGFGASFGDFLGSNFGTSFVTEARLKFSRRSLGKDHPREVHGGQLLSDQKPCAADPNRVQTFRQILPTMHKIINVVNDNTLISCQLGVLPTAFITRRWTTLKSIEFAWGEALGCAH